ncbi:DUF998 domain-containing protein [Lysobacter humi (ex Lee et al. 2017)]
MHLPVTPARACALLAAIAFAGAVAVFGGRFEVYSQLAHPVAMLGASGVPRATAFNVLAYMLPGALAAATSLILRERLRTARWTARLGTQALAFAGIAFALQGLWPLDSRDLFARSSHLHGAAWTFWWVAFATGAVLLFAGLRERQHRGRALLVLGLSLLTLLAALVGSHVLPVGLAQRIAFGSYFAALLVAAGLSRSAA